jgi:hypothetical protein
MWVSAPTRSSALARFLDLLGDGLDPAVTVADQRDRAVEPPTYASPEYLA